MTTTFWRLPNHPLQELRVGEFVTINGDRLRVTSLTIEPAKEDDRELGIQAGDPVTTVTFDRPPPREPGPCPVCGWLVGDVTGHRLTAHP